MITATHLYNHIQCPHRIWRDKYGPQEEKIKETNPFVQLLWDRGIQHEEKIVSSIGEYVDMSSGTIEERFENTIRALRNGSNLIYQGVLIYDNMIGIPDLLRKISENEYLPIDIKAGRGFEGINDEGIGKQKKHYALQLCHYSNVLTKLGYAKKRSGLIIDNEGDEIEYILDMPMGKKSLKTYWQCYEETKAEVWELINNNKQNKPAISGTCKICPWYNSCKKWCIDSEDLTNIFYLGRGKRDIINKQLGLSKIDEVTALDIDSILAQKKQDKSFLKGVGPAILESIKRRANVLYNIKKPVIYEKLNFPEVQTELFFDIEDDPTQDYIYMHGVYERTGLKERYLSFVAKDFSEESEKEAWQRFWDYIQSINGDFSIYYYSSHEKTAYKRLQKKYSDVISLEDVEKFYDSENAIDLYSIVFKYTDWPLSSYSLKDIASFLNFKWRDDTPSGALSIQWYNEYLKTKEEKIMNRILEYNEDDCKATMILKDSIINFYE